MRRIFLQLALAAGAANALPADEPSSTSLPAPQPTEAITEDVVNSLENPGGVNGTAQPVSFRRIRPVVPIENVTAPIAAPAKLTLEELRAKVASAKLDPATHPPLNNSKNLMLFEYGEHGWLGDNILLKDEKGKLIQAMRRPFTLNNGLQVTYGQINGLGGDFYGTINPISDGVDLHDQQRRFLRAWYWLAEDTTRNPSEARRILAVLMDEARQVAKAYREHRSVEEVYKTLPDINIAMEAITVGRPPDAPGYLNLAKINWDHFGADARVAYNAAHSVALDTAAAGDLWTAYAMNAFADHFLEDSFASGHLRTPRRYLHKSTEPFADLCAKYMHDEDNTFGLVVKNPKGFTWRSYGDKKLLEEMDNDNKNMVRRALQASVEEIYQAFAKKVIPQAPNYEAWQWAPTLESATTGQAVVALFNEQGKRRKHLKKRCTPGHTGGYWFWSTVSQIQSSGLWGENMTLTSDCPPQDNKLEPIPEVPETDEDDSDGDPDETAPKPEDEKAFREAAEANGMLNFDVA